MSSPSGRASTQSQRVDGVQRLDAGRRPAPGGDASAGCRVAVPTKTWCSWVTSATWPRRSSSGSSTSADAADRRPSRCAAGGCPRAAGRASTCRRPDGPTIASRSPGLDVEVDAVQHVAALDVGEADVRRRRCSLAVGLARRSASRSSGTSATPSSRASEARADLELVEPREQPVDRVDELLHVERRGGDLARATPARGCRASRRSAASPRSGSRSRPRPRGTRPCAGTACSARRAYDSRDVGVDRGDAAAARARAPRRCGRRRPSRRGVALIVGVRRALAQVARPWRAREVPARSRRTAIGTPSSAAAREHPAPTSTRAPTVTHAGDQRDRASRAARSGPTTPASRRRARCARAGRRMPARSTADRQAERPARRSPRAARRAPARRAPEET